MRTKVTTITCPKCSTEIYSRAHHDFHSCECGGTCVDGGFDYLRYLYPNGSEKPKIRTRYVSASRQELYDDWNKMVNKFGLIARKK